ncbi:hypothetical protein BBP40_007372 [Aspergillus hancockii]|nr:hypothetical protein BBP40_007372 [Aspergillus hancockii]
MADGLSLTASVIAVAGLAYSSSKMLYQTVSNIHGAPGTINHLKSDVQDLYETISDFQKGLQNENTTETLSETQKSTLCQIKPALEGYRSACDAFKDKIVKLMCHSSEGHTSLRDRIKL